MIVALRSWGASARRCALQTSIAWPLRALRFNAFHVTALCSPTRACLLTGRNHHAVGMGLFPEVPGASAGYSGRLPDDVATLPRALRDAGYSTFAVGKWHLTPLRERSAAGPFTRWPLGLGFERYYGFLGAEANQWSPSLVADNHAIAVSGERGGRLSPERGPRGSGHQADPRSAPGQTGPAVLPVFRAGRTARAAPRGARVERSVPGSVRRRVGGHARARLRPPTGAGRGAVRDAADAAPVVGHRLGRALQ